MVVLLVVVEKIHLLVLPSAVVSPSCWVCRQDMPISSAKEKNKRGNPMMNRPLGISGGGFIVFGL